jgi:hypothetical protein
MSRPSVERSEKVRKKDMALMWMIEWLKDIEASLEVMHDIVDQPPLKAAGLDKFEVPVTDIKDKVGELIDDMENEPA